jgi:hypothetical protein
MKLSADPAKTGQARLGLPGNVNIITGQGRLPSPPPVKTGKAGHQADLPAIGETGGIG